MIYEVVRWISIVMLWVAVAANVYATVLQILIRRKLEEQLRIWRTRNEQNEVKE